MHINDGLLHWVGIEINNSRLANVLNVILSPVLQIRCDHTRSSICRLVRLSSKHWPGSQTDFSTKVNILHIWTLLGLCAWPPIGCCNDLSVSRTWLRRRKKGPCRARKCLAWQIWSSFLHAIRGLFHITDMDSKCSLSSARVAFLDLKFDD